MVTYMYTSAYHLLSAYYLSTYCYKHMHLLTRFCGISHIHVYIGVMALSVLDATQDFALKIWCGEQSTKCIMCSALCAQLARRSLQLVNNYF